MTLTCNVPYCNNEATYKGDGPQGESILVCGLHSVDSDRRLRADEYPL